METPVTQNALIQRLRRKLAHEAVTLHKARNPRDYAPFYLLDSHNHPIGPSVDPARLARSLGVLYPGEVAEDLDGRLVRGKSVRRGVTLGLADALADGAA